ncbi:mechanosensitive ion channel family protein [Candidatus Woesearchaeota archaeon]|nr:mechanosensitive ion channel family protein [Candidatus Woesearchaeota archaeon]
MIQLPEFVSVIWNVHYLRALAIFIASYLVMQVLVFILEGIILKLTKKTKTEVDNLIVQGTKKPLAVLVLLFGARLGTEALQYPEAFTGAIQQIITSLIVIVIARILVVILNVIIDQWGKKLVSKTKSSLDDDILVMFHRFVKVVIYLLAIIYILGIWGIQVGPLLASLGVAGIAVAFALQSTLGNIFGGISLILDKAVRIGDNIELDDGTSGTVTKVTLRSTRIRTWNNELMTIPNGKLADSKLTNWNLPNKRIRAVIEFGVEYGSDIANVKKTVLAVVKKEKKILKNPAPYVLFTQMADFSLNFSLRFWLDDVSERLDMKDKITTEIYNALNKNKIGIPFPTHTVHLEK